MRKSLEEVATINAICPGNHAHDTWGLVQQGSKRVFATSLEVHYPTELCEAITHAFILRLVVLGLKFNPQSSLQRDSRMATLQQAPSAKLPPLVPPFKSRILTFYNNEQLVWPLTFAVIPACKLLRKFQVGGLVQVQNLQQQQGVLDRLQSELDAWCIDFDLQALAKNFQFEFDSARIFGVQWEPDEFLKKACEIGHPLSPGLALPKELAQSIEMCAKCGVAVIARKALGDFQILE